MTWATHSLLYTRHTLMKRFTLRLIKSVKFTYCPYEERRKVAGVWGFYERCLGPKAIKSNPQCKVEMDFDETGQKNPAVRVEFEDGRVLDFKDASYVPMSLIMEAVHLKKRHIKHFYRQTNKEFFDSDDEDEQTMKEKEAEETQGGKGKKK